MPARPWQSKLTVRPCSFAVAKAFVALHHRHHKPPAGHKFSLAVYDDSGTLRGVAIVGRPVARRSDNGTTLEVNRVATDGTPNACSALYGAARREAIRRKSSRLLTFVLASEPGTSLIAAGWTKTGETRGSSWSVKSRPRENKHPLGLKHRYEANMPGKLEQKSGTMGKFTI